MTLPKDEIVWAWNTTKITSGELARKYGVTRGVILGIVHRDPRAVKRRPLSPMQRKDRHIKALEAEVRRLQELEVSLAHRKAA